MSRTYANPSTHVVLGDGGMNTVRLRLWVHPELPYDGTSSPHTCTMKLLTRIDGYYETYNVNYTLTLAKRFYDKGYKIYLDYHFSNYWV